MEIDIPTIKQFISNFFTEGHERSIQVKKNVFYSLLIKGVSILLNLLLVPITISYVSAEGYGIWLTVYSIVLWFNFFDIGLSNGLRNKLAASLATDNLSHARAYVSTTYMSLGFIFGLLWLLFVFFNHHLNWASLLKISDHLSTEVTYLVGIVFSFFCFQFVLRTINTILIADQHPAKSALIDLIGQLIAFISICVLVVYTKGSLVNLGLGLTIPPFITLLVASIYLFKTKYRYLRPSFSLAKAWLLKDLFGLSIKFFIIQTAALIQYQTANIIIARFFGMEEVTTYNISYKYFNVLGMVFVILLTPFWSAATDAYVRKDYTWITTSVKRYLQILLPISVLGLLMLALSPFAYRLWVGEVSQTIPYILSLWSFLYVISFVFGSIFIQLINGIGTIKIQYISSWISPFLFIGLCYYFIYYMQLGVYAIFIASILSNFNGIILAPIQYYKIFIKKRSGIWVQ